MVYSTFPRYLACITDRHAPVSMHASTAVNVVGLFLFGSATLKCGVLASGRFLDAGTSQLESSESPVKQNVC